MAIISINDHAALLTEKLEGQGYSLMTHEVQLALITTLYDYMTWFGDLEYVEGNILTGSSLISTDELSLTDRLTRSRCDVVHINSELGAGLLGVTHSGLDINTATANVDMHLAALKIEASFELPYSINEVD